MIDRTTQLLEEGDVLTEKNQFNDALQHYFKALPILRELNHKRKEGHTRIKIGTIFYQLGQYEDAINNFNYALPLIKIVNDKYAEWAILCYIGKSYDCKGQYEDALKCYNDAIIVNKNNGDKHAEGTTLNMRGLVYKNLGQYESAINCFNEAIIINKDLGDREGEAITLNNFANVYDYQGKYAEALDYYLESLSIIRKTGNKIIIASALNNIGLVYHKKGLYMRAFENYREVLSIREEAEDKHGIATTLNCIGIVYSSKGQYKEALKYYENALSIRKEIGDRQGVGTTLNNIGIVLSHLSQYAKSLKYFEDSLSISREIGNILGEGENLHNIAAVYNSLNQSKNSLKYYEDALSVRRKVGDKYGEANSLNNIGYTLYCLGRFQEALKCYKDALSIRREIQDRLGVATTLSNFGSIYVSLEKSKDAFECFNGALTIIREIGNKKEEGDVLNEIGNLYHSLNQSENSMKHYDEALLISKEIGDKLGEGITLRNIANLKEETGCDSDAIEKYKESIKLFDEIRNNLLTEEKKSSFIERRMGTYESLISLLKENERYEECLDFMENAKARNFLDLIGSRKIPFKKEAPLELLSKYEKLVDEIEENTICIEGLRKRQIDFQEKGLNAEVEEINEMIKHSLKVTTEKREYKQDIWELIRSKNAEIASTKGVTPLNHQEIQELLPENGALLEYFIGSKEIFLQLVTKDHTKTLKVEIAPDELVKSVTDYKVKILQTRLYDNDYVESSKKLYELLIKPANLFKSNTQLLYIVPHGILHYLPFCSLISEDEHFLIEDYEIVYSPSASAIHYAMQKKTGRNDSILAMAPFANAPLEDGGLPASKSEVQEVCTLYKEHQPFLDKRGTKDIAFELSGKVDHVLFSTHGKMLLDDPLDSSLFFSEGEQLRVNEVFDMNLKAELVTLSACETGLVGTNESRELQGDDMVGLSRAFIYAGTPSIVATLWKVSDVHTAIVMINFNKNLKNGMLKSKALRKAQLDLIESKQDANGSPYYWAPFVLIGDYR